MDNKKQKYLTEYYHGGSTYGSEIYASSKKEAEDICRKRNIGERVLGIHKTKYPKGYKEPTGHNALIHEACFLGFICIKAGILSVDDILGDTGILHMLIHKEWDKQEIVIRMEYLRGITPGNTK